MKRNPLSDVNEAYSLSTICEKLIDKARDFSESRVEIKLRLGKEK